MKSFRNLAAVLISATLCVAPLGLLAQATVTEMSQRLYTLMQRPARTEIPVPV